MEGDVFLPSVVGKMDEGVEVNNGLKSQPRKIDEGGEVKKGSRKGSKFYIVSKVQGGDGGLVKKVDGKRKLGLNKKSSRKGLIDEEDMDNDVRVGKRIRKSKKDGEGVSKNQGETGHGCKGVM